MSKKAALLVLGVLVASFGLIQLIPYGRSHDNPPVLREPAWDSPATRELARRACFDCHSNESVWPWYSNIAPVSWLVSHDVEEARRELNFSEWNPGSARRAGELAEPVAEGEMPPPAYLALHPEARLSDTQRGELLRGLERSLSKVYAAP